MAVSRDPYNTSTHHVGSAPEQDQRQFKPEHASYVPETLGLNFASINEVVQQPCHSSQTQTDSSPNKRRKPCIGYKYNWLPSKADPNMSSFMQEPLTYTVTAPPQDNEQQGCYAQGIRMSSIYESSENFGSASYAHSSPAQKTSVLAPQTFYLPKLLQQQQPQAVAPISNDRWAQAREYRRKVYEPPQIDPYRDPTIAEVEENAESWVIELVTAMSNTENVKDSKTSHAFRTFYPDNISPLLIEAASREIFTSLIDRCKHGFRGPASFNKAIKPHKDSEPDKTALCKQRIENVVDVLACNKRACKDVLHEDWKIRLLVNHPLAYDKEKDSQKGSNDQRRIRLQQERDKLRHTEEELRAVREAGMNHFGQDAVGQLEGALTKDQRPRVNQGS